MAFEAAGVEDTFHQAIAVVRRAGRVVVVGAAPSSMRVPISPFDLFARELKCHGLVPQPAHSRTSCPTGCFGCARPPSADHEDDRSQRCPRRAQPPPRPGRDKGPGGAQMISALGETLTPSALGGLVDGFQH